MEDGVTTVGGIYCSVVLLDDTIFSKDKETNIHVGIVFLFNTV